MLTNSKGIYHINIYIYSIYTDMILIIRRLGHQSWDEWSIPKFKELSLDRPGLDHHRTDRIRGGHWPMVRCLVPNPDRGRCSTLSNWSQ